MPDDGQHPSLEGRVAALEREVRQLRAELVGARGGAERHAVSSAAPEPRQTPAMSTPPRAPVATPRIDLETLVGRYGMLGLATLLALAAIGTFVSWAVAHGLLGPTPRVLLGVVAAAAIGAAGLKLRSRSRSFGDSLLALALAAIHVCAWAAGPSLGLVPAPLALACSAAASIALGAFALLEADEPLWCVGFGGACVAPFVTSTGHGTAPMLAAYATAVLVAGGTGLGSRSWSIAGRVFAAGAALFVAALLAMPNAQHAPLLALALPLVAAGFGVLPFARGPVLRPRLRTLGLLATAGCFRLAFAPLPWMGRIGAAIAIGIAGCAWLALVELADGEPLGRLFDGWGETDDLPAAWIEGALLPALFLGALGVALEVDAGPAFGLAAAILLAATARRSGACRDALAASAWAAAMAATWLSTRSTEAVAIVSVAWASIVLLWLGRWVPTRSWTWTSRISLTVAGLGALVILAARPQYEFVPLVTRESAAALAVALAWAAAAYEDRQDGDSLAWLTARLGFGAFVFLWGHHELVDAISPTASSLLLIGYYATTSVGFVAWGRARHSPALRRVGLGLGLIAAFLAARGAWKLPAAGTRIAAYLLVSVFLLGIAWWYRQPDDGEAWVAQKAD